MTNYSDQTASKQTRKPDSLLSGQIDGQRKISIKEIKEQVKATNVAKQYYDKEHEKRNSQIFQYLLENDSPETVYALAYEIKLTPATIYNIKKLQERRSK